jgi:hypothetical protein
MTLNSDVNINAVRDPIIGKWVCSTGQNGPFLFFRYINKRRVGDLNSDGRRYQSQSSYQTVAVPGSRLNYGGRLTRQKELLK